MGQCTLKLGDHVLLVSDGAVPDAEYALFDPRDIELGASEPGIIREVGFATVVGQARERLEEVGLTAAAGSEAAEAARPVVSRAYARGAAVRQAIPALDAVELFEGGTFDGTSGTYAGTWLELGSLSRDLAVPGASALLQALHLAALLAEHDDDEPLTLATADVTASRKAGERTYRRPQLGDPRELVRAIAALQPRARRCEEGPCPQEILARLAARPRRTPASRDRMKAAEAALSARDAPPAGPLADPELWAIELALSDGDAGRALGAIDAVEQRRGRIPATAYLRARAALVAGTEAPRAVAEKASALAGSMTNFHEVELLSAQAWAAAGEARRAAAFARDLVGNAAAPDSVRMRAQDLLAAAPASTVPRSRTSLEAIAGVSVAATPAVGRADSVRPQAAGGQAAPTSVPPPSLAGGEPLETLGLPAGALDATGEAGGPSSGAPRTPMEARVHCTLLARELGRELREQGSISSCDVDGLEMAQRALREAVPEAGSRPLRPDEQRHVARHGAFLSELLARKLGARWVDLAAGDPQRWAMAVPAATRSEPVRIWPFARVARFAAMGHKERDLVSYYLEVEARTRGK